MLCFKTILKLCQPSSEFGLKIDIFGGFDWLKVQKASSYDQYW